jgi:hypothetical protein
MLDGMSVRSSLHSKQRFVMSKSSTQKKIVARASIAVGMVAFTLMLTALMSWIIWQYWLPNLNHGQWKGDFPPFLLTSAPIFILGALAAVGLVLMSVLIINGIVMGISALIHWIASGDSNYS